MVWKMVVLEREPLYAEVWAEPVRTVSKRYGLSDVGLRKICKKLGVPLPPLGYWARIAAGRKPRATQLPANHKGETRYVRQVRVDEDAEERSARSKALLANEAPAEWPAVVVKQTADDLLLVVKRTGSRMGHRQGLLKALLESRGGDVFEVRTTEEQKVRALRIIDAVISTALVTGAKIVAGEKEGTKVHLDVCGEVVHLRLEEEIARKQREPTDTERAKQAKDTWYKPDLWVYSPTGKLKLTLLGPSHYNPFVTARDGVATPLERRLDDVIPRLWAKIAELRVDAQMRAEEHARWELERKRREAIEASRKAAIDRLEKTEAFAKRWQRAADLRKYAEAVELVGRGQTAASSEVSVEEEVAWIRNAADWLDPIVRKHWCEVDGDAPESVEDDGDDDYRN